MCQDCLLNCLCQGCVGCREWAGKSIANQQQIQKLNALLHDMGQQRADLEAERKRNLELVERVTELGLKLERMRVSEPPG